MSSIPSITDVTFGTKDTGNRFYGRYWKLTVTKPPENGSQVVLTADSSSDLRVTFDIYTARIKDAFWYADVVVYNLAHGTTAQIMGNPQDPRVDPMQVQPGAIVTLEAGYKNGAQGVIWQGALFQQTWERENVTDFKLTLRCCIGLLSFGNENGISYAVGALQSENEVARQVMENAFRKIPVSYIAPLNLPPLPRGQAFFGNVSDYLDEISSEAGMEWFVTMHGLELAVGTEGAEDLQPELVFGSPDADTMEVKGDGIIIGSPQQTQEGVSFVTLLDPRLHVSPIQKVKIDNSSIQRLKRSIGQDLNSILDQDGLYFVQAVRHYGDTRGGPWYSEVTGVTPQFLPLLRKAWAGQ